jgi:osmoprotectant transport system ATP-binding protein
MIVAEHISKQFNHHLAVNDLSFEVKEGETLVLLGTSGCGKTTTLRMINRLIEPTSGKIYINGRNIHEEKAEVLRRNIGYVLQNHGLFPHYTVAENIAIVPQLLKWPKEKKDKRIIELLDKLQLLQQISTVYPHELSGGQQQRIGLARALAADPHILLMDEPFGALDPITRVSVRALFSRLDEVKKKTIVLVTHDIQEAFEVGDKICLMDKGEMMQMGTPAELIFSPVNDFVQQFFDQERFQLELQSIKIRDVWDQLPHADEYNDLVLSPNHQLWHAMELIVGDAKNIYIQSEDRREVKEISLTTIQTILKNIKSSQQHAGPRNPVAVHDATVR